MAQSDLDQLCINTIRTLSMDAVEQANSGHPGTPMALAPVAHVLWNEVLRYDPTRPHWPNRDRFVLSCGHASMLLYSVLHLAGVRQLDHDGRPTGEDAVTLDQIKNFRQLHSRTPGHPEYRDTSGVETTTGPLGQGCGNSVGMAIAGQWLGARFNQPGCELFDFNVYVLCSDGDVMEGIGCEAASLAGHLRLGNLCWIYDDNKITIEGDTSLAFTEDVGARFQALGWNVLRVAEANDLPAIRAALRTFQDTNDRPTLIVLRSQIAWGAPNKQGTHEAHGAPLGEAEIRATKSFYGWNPDQKFHVPAGVREHYEQGVGRRGAQASLAWEKRRETFAKEHPALADELVCIARHKLPAGWDAGIPTFPADEKGLATRVASGKVLNAVAERTPWLLGGSADLSPSNNTRLGFAGVTDFSASNHSGRNFHFGVREHAMGAALNGMALCGLRPYGGTFLIFSDYLRPSFRLAALMKLPPLFIFTHDSIGLGEDGPTHQPVEHLAALRAIPNSLVVRPCDANETSAAYKAILSTSDRPAALVLTRQNLPTFDRSKFASADGLARGGYVLANAANPQVILMASGSEVSLCMEARARLEKDGIAARVVSLPCFEWFDEQDASYCDTVLPPTITARVAVEAGIVQGWKRYLGPRGVFIGMSSFGASAPAKELFKHFGISVENIVAAAKRLTETR